MKRVFLLFKERMDKIVLLLNYLLMKLLLLSSILIVLDLMEVMVEGLKVRSQQYISLCNGQMKIHQKALINFLN
uniref:Uncharacterized protein n=1 Tax=Meloidogyne enterolobii TaxID=390850 RepID=A0A6V7X4P1_MELEN|nr:unnamed protein product [Meloidogyne enterolobii]